MSDPWPASCRPRSMSPSRAAQRLIVSRCDVRGDRSARPRPSGRAIPPAPRSGIEGGLRSPSTYCPRAPRNELTHSPGWRFGLMSKTEARLSCAEVIIRIIRPRLVPARTPIIRRWFVVPRLAIAHAAPSNLFGLNGVGARIARAGRVAEGHRIRLDHNHQEGAGRRCRQQSELAHDFLLLIVITAPPP